MNNSESLLSRKAKSLQRRLFDWLAPDADFFLRQVSGVIHVGAHRGEERDIYAKKGIHVMWVEADPGLFPDLQKAIAAHPKQRASCNLLTDSDDKAYEFHISSNDGASSSVLELGGHKKVWPEIRYVKTITLRSVTLSTLAKREKWNLTHYDSLVMDAQGSELLVLKGAVDILDRFKFIKTEVADFDLYQDCGKLSEMDQFLASHHFRRVLTRPFFETRPFANQAGLGSVYDVVYSRKT